MIRASAVLVSFFTLVTGVLYPLVVTGLGQWLWPAQARGSLIIDARHAVRGSALIGQQVHDMTLFFGRPSATQYDGVASGGSNLGPSNARLVSVMTQHAKTLEESGAPVPAELVSASGSGLDPDVSVRSALYQVPRVARLRGLDVQRVRALVEAHVQGRTFGILGEPRVNVLELNLALEQVR